MKLPEKQNESQADKGSQHIPQHVTARGDNVTVHPPHHKKKNDHPVTQISYTCSFVINSYLIRINLLLYIKMFYGHHWQSTVYQQCFQIYTMTIWTTAEHDASPWTLQIIYNKHIMNALYFTTTSDNITINILYQMNHFDKWCCLFWCTKLFVFFIIDTIFFYFVFVYTTSHF